MYELTDPICTDCMLKHLQEYLCLHHVPGIKKILKKVKKRVQKESLNEDKCIMCGREASLCSYCFYSISTKILYELDINTSVIESIEKIYLQKKETITKDIEGEPKKQRLGNDETLEIFYDDFNQNPEEDF